MWEGNQYASRCASRNWTWNLAPRIWRSLIPRTKATPGAVSSTQHRSKCHTFIKGMKGCWDAVRLMLIMWPSTIPFLQAARPLDPAIHLRHRFRQCVQRLRHERCHFSPTAPWRFWLQEGTWNEGGCSHNYGHRSCELLATTSEANSQL